MEVLTPEPIDAKRALTDVAYFAKMYLDIELNPVECVAVESTLNGVNVQLGGLRNGRRQMVFKTIIAMAKRKGIKVRVVEKEEFIDVDPI